MGKLIIPENKKASWDALDSVFRDQIVELTFAVPIDTILVYGGRSAEEQQALYDQGRTKPGNIVTKAKPGTSAHNWGLAVDLLPVNPATKKGDWNYEDGFRTIAIKAKEMGLNPGYFWKGFKDSPHIESPRFSTAKAQEWMRQGRQMVTTTVKKAAAALTSVAKKPAGIAGGLLLVAALMGILFF